MSRTAEERQVELGNLCWAYQDERIRNDPRYREAVDRLRREQEQEAEEQREGEPA